MISTITSTTAVKQNPMALMVWLRRIRRRSRPSCSLRSSLFQCRIMPELGEGERDEHPDDVELDQRADVGLERDDQDQRDDGQEHDAVGEGQPVAAGVQLAGQVAVLREDRAEHRKAVERGVAGQHQDQAGDERDDVEADREAGEHRLGDLRDQRLLVVAGRGSDQLLGRVVGVLHAGDQRQRHQPQHHRHRQRGHQRRAWSRRCGTWAS